MQVTLTPQAQELLRVVQELHQSPAEILEQALAESVQRESGTTRLTRTKYSQQEFEAWLDQFSKFSDRIPAMPGETFSREMIYQDHDFAER
jgi:DNA-binding transcriptional LysR family regulator